MSKHKRPSISEFWYAKPIRPTWGKIGWEWCTRETNTDPGSNVLQEEKNGVSLEMAGALRKDNMLKSDNKEQKVAEPRMNFNHRYAFVEAIWIEN